MTCSIAINRRAYDTWRMRLLTTLLLLGIAALMPARAEDFDLEAALKAQHVQYDGGPDYSTVQSGGASLSEAIESVRRRTGGKVVSADTRVEKGREVHYIKVLTPDGKVKTHRVNGRKR